MTAAVTAGPTGPRPGTTSTRSRTTWRPSSTILTYTTSLSSVTHSEAAELVRYLTRHGDARIARMVLVAPTTPMLRRTADNPDGWDPALVDANYAAVAANVPQWCADFEAAGPIFGSSLGSSPGLVDWTMRMIVDTPLPRAAEDAEAEHQRQHG